MRGKERDGGKEREGTEDDRRKDDGINCNVVSGLYYVLQWKQ